MEHNSTECFNAETVRTCPEREQEMRAQREGEQLDQAELVRKLEEGTP